MKAYIIKCILLLLGILLAASPCLWSQQYPIVVVVHPSPPFPPSLTEEYEEKINDPLVTLTNLSSKKQELRLAATLTGDNGISVSLKSNFHQQSAITLNPGENRTFTPYDLSAFMGDLSYSDFDIQGLSNSERDQFLLNRSIPEGNYQICVRVFDFQTGQALSAPEPGGCSQQIQIIYLDPPVIISPTEEEQIQPSHPQNVFISWSNLSTSSDIRYRIKMIDLGEIGSLSVYEAINNPGTPVQFEKEGIENNTYTYSPLDPILVPGHSYAIQVKAYDPTGKVLFRLNGESDIIRFSYGGCNPNNLFYLLSNAFPMNMDTVAVGANGFTPLIVKYDPYCDGYRKIVFDVSLQDEDGKIYNRKDDNKWPRGPLHFLQRYFPDATEEDASYLPLNVQEDQTKIIQLKRGKTYTWWINTKMYTDPYTFESSFLPPQKFTIGMTKPRPLYPKNKAVEKKGKITFKWKSKPPKRSAPTLERLHRITGSNLGTQIVTTAAFEKWQIQVATDRNFANTDIIYRASGTLGGPHVKYPDLTEEEIRDEMYQELSKTFEINQAGTYYWRVLFFEDPEAAQSQPYLYGPISEFTIEEETDPQKQDPCKANCDAEPVSNITPVSQLQIGESIRMGRFLMKIQSFTSSQAPYAGRGIIQIPWLNNIRIKVDFSGLKVNTDYVVYEGKADAIEEDVPFTVNEVSSTVGDILSLAPGVERQVNSYLSEGRLISAMTDEREIGMPIGIDKKIVGHTFTIGIVGMTFSPKNATLKALAVLDFKADWNKYTPAFGAQDICFHPNGLEDVGVLYLSRSFYIFDTNWPVYLQMKGAEDAFDSDQVTRIEWDCDGYKCLNVAGELTFKRQLLVPEDKDGKPSQGQVKGRIRGQQCRGNNWIFQLDMDPFQIPGAPGYTFHVDNAYLDLSDLDNPEGLTFPDNYETNIDLEDEDQVNNWKGFWLEQLKIEAPQDFTFGSGASAGVHNMIIDREGFTASFRINDFVPLDKGNYKGWGLSVDKFELDILQNSFTHASMQGKVDIPVMKEGQHLVYQALLTNDQSLGFQFRVDPTDDIEIEMLAAKMEIEQNSYIDIRLGRQKDQFRKDYMEANLVGSIDIADQNVRNILDVAGKFIPALDIPGVHAHITYSTDKGFTKTVLSKASPQKSLSGFPITIKDIALHPSATGLALEISPRVSLTGGSTSIGADTKIVIESELNLLGKNQRKKFKIKDIRVDRIWIEAAVSEFELKGYLEFYKDQSRKGVKGGVEVKLPMKLGLKTNVEFGVVKTSPSARYDTPGYFSYWYVDGMVSIPTGIPIANGFAIYGFGGGAYYHMRANSNNLTSAKDCYKRGGTEENPAPSGQKYIPDFNTKFGFYGAAIFGSHPYPEAVNLETRIGASFNQHGGLNSIRIQGDLQVMSKIATGGSKKMIWANVDILYVKEAGNSRIDGSLNLHMDTKTVRGSGPNNLLVNARLHAGPGMWFLHAGNYTQRAGMTLKTPFRVGMSGYLMVGHGIPRHLPEPPGFIGRLMGISRMKSDHGKLTVSNQGGPNNRTNMWDYETGQGFALGLAFQTEIGISVKVLRASLKVGIGSDIKIGKFSGCKGFNGWQGAGQAYAGLEGKLKIEGFTVLELGAAVLLRGEAPNPVGFKGKAALKYKILGLGITENTIRFSVKVGKMCSE